METAQTCQPEQSVNSEDAVLDAIDPRLLSLGFIWPVFDIRCEFDSTVELVPSQSAAASDKMDMNDECLQSRLDHLQTELRHIFTTERSYSDVFHSDSWEKFFTVSSLRESLRMFFAEEQMLATLIHEPTFHPEVVDSSLLLAVAIAGFTFLQFRQRKSGFMPCILAVRELAEHYIFRCMEVLPSLQRHGENRARALEVCQAAYIIETLQFSVKDSNINRRLITKRHPILVDMHRDLDPVNNPYGLSSSGSEWNRFVYTESYNRLKHWLFINDAWFSLLSNNPPAMTFYDMQSELPCQDEIWRAYSAAEFEVLRSQGRDQPTCLGDLIDSLLNEECEESVMATFEKIDVKSFLILILGLSFPLCKLPNVRGMLILTSVAAFQHIIFHQSSIKITQHIRSKLLRALNRYEQYCSRKINHVEEEEKRRLGVVKYCAELATLFHRIVELNEARDSVKAGYLERRVCFGVEVIHDFILRCEDGLQKVSSEQNAFRDYR